MKKALITALFISSIGLSSSHASAGFSDWWCWLTDWFTGQVTSFAVGSYKVKEIITKEHPLKRDGFVVVETVNGQVVIEGWDKDHIKIEAIKRGKTKAEFEKFDIVMNLSNDRAEIKTVPKTRGTIKAAVDYNIKVPTFAHLKSIRTINGAINIDDVKGAIQAFSDNGAINIDGAKNAVTARTKNGSIKVNGATHPVDVRTNNGSIEIDGATSFVDARTNNGLIVVEQKRFPSNAHIFLKTDIGAITLALPKDVGAQITTRTQMGTMNSDFSIQNGIIGNGGGKIELTNQIGSITIKKD